MKMEDIANAIKAAAEDLKKKAIAVLEVEAVKSVQKNFEAGGRPKWEPRKKVSKKQRGTKLLVVSGNMSNVTAEAAGDKVVIKGNPLSRAYSQIQNEGGVINVPSRAVRHRKVTSGKNKGRTVFASSRASRFAGSRASRFAGSRNKKATETKTKAYKITIPARPFMVIPEEDRRMILGKIRDSFLK